jgi:hypothetical protein
MVAVPVISAVLWSQSQGSRAASIRLQLSLNDGFSRAEAALKAIGGMVTRRDVDLGRAGSGLGWLPDDGRFQTVRDGLATAEHLPSPIPPVTTPRLPPRGGRASLSKHSVALVGGCQTYLAKPQSFHVYSAITVGPLGYMP